LVPSIALTVSVTWSPAAIRVGESATVIYSSQHAQSCQATLDGEFQGAGPVETSGSLQHTFTQPGEQVFSYTCTGPGGSATGSATLTVNPEVPAVAAEVLLSDGRTVRLVSSAGSVVNARTVSRPANLPAGFMPITEFIGFDVAGITSGSTVVVTLTLPAGVTPSAYLKCAPVCAVFSGASISGNQVRLTLTDGGAGDADGVANGMIQDPGAPAVATEPETPHSPIRGGGAISMPMLLLLLAAGFAAARARAPIARPGG